MSSAASWLFMREIEVGGRKLCIAEADWEAEAGAVVWDAALCILKYLEVHPTLVAGKRVIELGAGPGAVGCTAAALGAAAVVLTDLPAIVPLAAQNIESNDLSSTATAAALPWGDTPCLEQLLRACGGAPFDVILASDVLYQAHALPLFVQTLSALFAANPHALGLLCIEHREALPFPQALFEAAGLGLRRVPLSEQHPQWSSEDIHLFHIKLAAAGRQLGS